MLGSAGVIGTRWLGPQTIGEQARRILLQKLRSHYPEWEIDIERGRYQHGVGLVFESIGLNPRVSSSASVQESLHRWWSADDAIHIDRLVIHGDFDVRKCLNDQNPITTHRMIVEGVHAVVSLDASERARFMGLWPLPKMGPPCPRIDVVNARLMIEADVGGGSEYTNATPESSEADLPISLQFSQLTILNHAKKTDDPSGGAMELSKRISASGSSSIANEFTFSVDQTAQDGNIKSAQLECDCKQFRCDDRLLRRLSPLIPSEMDWMVGDQRFDGIADVHVRAAWPAVTNGQRDHPTVGPKLDYELDVQVHDGSWSDPRLLHAISSVRGRLVATPESVQLRPTQASYGDAMCQVNAEMRWKRSSSTPAPETLATAISSLSDLNLGSAEFHASADGLTVDHSIAGVLPPKARTAWDKFDPRGRLNVSLDASSDSPLNSSSWDLRGSVECLGVDVQYDRFPYPIENLVGTIEFADSHAEARRLTGRAGGQIVRCGFRVPVGIPSHRLGVLDTAATRRMPKRIVVQTEGGVPIDGTLMQALTPRQTGSGTSSLERFVRSLHPSGAIELASAVVETDLRGVTTRQFNLRVLGGSIRYERFGYPLYNVAGNIQVENDLVRIIGFNANNSGAAQIQCDGLYQLPAQGLRESELNLRFRVANAAMDHSLRTSLPESTRGIWDSLAPSGALDRLDVHLHQIGRQDLQLSLEAIQSDSGSIAADTLTLRPTALPYRIDIVSGEANYRDGVLQISDIRGRHDASQLVADGRCAQQPDGRWKLSLDLLSGCRVTLDDELITALPTSVATATRQLDLRGPIQVRGKTDFLLQNPNEKTAPSQQQPTAPEIRWDLLLQLEGNRIGDVGPVHSIRGEVATRGLRNDRFVRAGGTIAIDSMHVFGLQIARLSGPYSIFNDELRLGSLASDSDPIASGDAAGRQVTDTDLPPPSPVVGRLFAGQLTSSGIVSLASGDFDVESSVEGADVGTMLAEIGQSGSDIRGRFDSAVRAEGRLGDMDLLKANGTARLSGANLYQLPFLVQVLNLLRIQATEDVAFTDGEAEFTLFGQDVNFGRLMLWGDLVALDGGGTLTRREQLNLSFNTRVSPQNLFSKVISPLRDERYAFWTIDVSGPVSAPTIQRRALSGITQTMESWFPGLIRSTTASQEAQLR
ncbi:MAG: hypothetical protein AAGJ40_22675 [Planctomycetota bacterium]